MTETENTDSFFRTLGRILPYIWRYKGWLWLSLVAFFIARLCEAAVPLFLKAGIDSIVAGDPELQAAAFGIIGFVVARYFVVSFARISLRRIGIDVAFDLRQELFGNLQRQGLIFFTRYGIGDMMTRAVSDIALIRRMINVGLILLVILVYATIIGFSFMLYLAPGLTLLLLPPLPLIAWYAWYAFGKMASSSKEVQDRLSNLGDHVQENLSGIRTIQAMAQEQREMERFAVTNQAYATAFQRQADINSQILAIMPTLVAICTLIVLGYGGSLVLTGEIPVGTFVAFFFYVNMVVQPVRAVGALLNLLQRGVIGCRRLFTVLDMPSEIQDAPSNRTPAQIQGTIRLQDLCYRYPGSSENILKGINLEIEPGETIAIMGRVGAGKTTLLHLLCRLLDPAPGAILVDGHDLRHYPLAQVRRQLVLVPQASFLFAETIAANVSYDDPDRPDTIVWQATESADLKATILSFPLLLETMVGERGVTLSGGQKQRATLARGIIRRAPVLLLDDCFASVDTETEERILTALRGLRSELTTLIVSHRVSTARHADRILILAGGRIRESGSHAQLLALGGEYAALASSQQASGSPQTPSAS